MFNDLAPVRRKIHTMNQPFHPSAIRLYEAARTLRGVTGQSAVARLLDETPQTVKNWETRGVSRRGAIKAQSAIGCNANWLLHDIGEMSPMPSDLDDGLELAPAAKGRVPLISWVQAGAFGDANDHFLPGEADEWVEVTKTKPGRNAFALRVSGDSMTSSIPGMMSFPAGTVIVVDPGRAADPGDYVIAKDVATQKATFKQLTYDGGRWFLKPINPAYPTIEIDDPAVRVIARAIEFHNSGKL